MMPRMTADLIARCTGQAKRKRGEAPDQYLRRITHLYCSEKGIDAIVSDIAMAVASSQAGKALAWPLFVSMYGVNYWTYS